MNVAGVGCTGCARMLFTGEAPGRRTVPLSALASGYCLVQRFTVDGRSKVTWTRQLRLGFLYQLPTAHG